MVFLRILVILLLLANIAWLGWTQWRVEPDPQVQPTPATVPAPADAPTLVLLSERPDPPPKCLTIGPFRDQAEAQRVSDRLDDYARRQQTRTTQATEDRGWWVYLPADESRSVAAQNMRDLRQAGFEEAYLINTGEFRNAVSLGLFGSEANARSLFNQVTSAGFQPVIGGRTETVAHYWVDYEPDDRIDAPWQIITRRDPLVGRHEIACFADAPTVAETAEEGDQEGSEESSSGAEDPAASNTAPAAGTPDIDSPDAEPGISGSEPEQGPAEADDEPDDTNPATDEPTGSP